MVTSVDMQRTYSSSRVFIAIVVTDQSSLVRIGHIIEEQSTNT